MRAVGLAAQRRLGAHERVVATRTGRASPSRRPSCSRLLELERRGSRRPVVEGRAARRRGVAEQRHDALSSSRRRAIVLSMIGSNTWQQALAGVAERVEPAGLDQRLDGALVEHRQVDPVAEVVEVAEGAVRVALGDDAGSTSAAAHVAHRREPEGDDLGAVVEAGGDEVGLTSG